MKFNKLFFLMVLVSMFACTDLEEQLNDQLTAEEANDFLSANTDVSALLRGSYDLMRLPYQDQSRFWAAQQHTTDETLGPTRGGDWDDGGVWRVLHDHTWGAEHSFLGDTFNDLLKIVFSTTNLLSFNPDAQTAAEARFLRAFVMFCIADGWNQVPFREPGDNLLNPPNVVSGPDAVDFVISECNEIMGDLPDGPTHRANKDAAKVLLMKAYLNKGVFSDRSAPKFETGDMTQVINLANDLAARYTLDDNFFDNFAPNNDAVSSENIWTAENIGGSSSGNVRSRDFCGLHYNQNPSGWNGFATLSDLYDSFESDDQRVYAEYPGSFEPGGINCGFLIGQQYDGAGNALEDRKGNPLAFTREVKLKETGNDLEITGIRVIKYPIDYNSGDNWDNDYVYFRYADVVLMKAEAMLRNGDSGGALAAVNELRAIRNASDLGSLTLDDLLAERARELYWEGWRRQDMIRFGKYLEPFQEKAATSGPERLLFAIPASSLSVNPNLVQNPGY